MNQVVEKIIAGDIRAAARLIRQVDDNADQARDHLKQLFRHTGKARVIGITGSPGVGKSTLTDALVTHIRSLGLTVGVLAVDPSSPFSGGAILGDRIRMQRHATDDGVFIRSMATRGHLGGLTQAARGAVMVLDAMGKDVVILETVGVGQDQIEVVRVAQTTVLVTVPGMGDDVQAIKAGIMEVGDIFVVNKADRQGAERAEQDLLAMIEMAEHSGLGYEEWKPPVLKTIAPKNRGIFELWDAIERHRDCVACGASEHSRTLARLKAKQELVEMVRQEVVERIIGGLETSGKLEPLIDEMLSGVTDPYTLTERLTKGLSE